jgi:hypothetical protein
MSLVNCKERRLELEVHHGVHRFPVFCYSLLKLSVLFIIKRNSQQKEVGQFKSIQERAKRRRQEKYLCCCVSCRSINLPTAAVETRCLLHVLSCTQTY